MARDSKVRMPSSGAGITSFSEEGLSMFKLKPIHVFALIVIVVLIEFFLYAFGYQLLGLR